MPKKAKLPKDNKKQLTVDDMFRYLEKKYVGTYRVLARYDLDTEDFPRTPEGRVDDSFDDQYIPCSKGEIRSTYRFKDGEPILAWYASSLGKGHNVLEDLNTKYKGIDIEVDEIGSFDYLIYFKESDLPKIATIVKPRTNGAKIPPYSTKNLPKEVYEIPEKDISALDKAMDGLDKTQRMLGLKKWYKEFDEIAKTKKGKKFNYDYEKSITKLSTKEFIHSIGLWKDFIDFVKEKSKEVKRG